MMSPHLVCGILDSFIYFKMPIAPPFGELQHGIGSDRAQEIDLPVRSGFGA